MILNQAVLRGEQGIGRHETLLLLAHITGKTHAELLINENQPLPDEANRAFLNALERREKGEPLQYIMGAWDFYGLTFKTDKRALIPRPETELLVEAVIKYTQKGGMSPLRVLDVCTGSGCIAITLAVLLDGNVEITAADIYADPLGLAKENAALHGVEDKIRFIKSDLASALQGKCFDIIVSNPPYIPTSEMAGLQREVRDYEPHLALDGGENGMDIYRRLLPQAYQLLRPGGMLFMEIGPNGVGELAENAGFKNIQVLKDYAGLDRIIKGEK
jgi:release factor glutamine methyltransferase